MSSPHKGGGGGKAKGPKGGGPSAGAAPAQAAKRAGTQAGQRPARTAPLVQRLTEQVDRERLPYRAAFAGAGVLAAIYLTIAHFTSSSVIGCPEGTLINCRTVLTSPESTLLGIPVALFGFVFFAVYLGTLYLRRQSSSPRQSQFALLWTVGGAVVVMVLLYTELFVVDAICLWCSFTHLMALSLLVLEIWPTAATDDARGDARRRARAQAHAHAQPAHGSRP